MKKNKINQKNKICLIGFPRSRSSFLLEALALHYNLNVELSIQRLSDKFVSKRLSYAEYRIRFTRLIEALNKSNTKFIVRIHPYQFIANSGKKFDLSELFDFDLFNFKQYKNIYVTKRNIVDRVCSLYIANKTGVWTYTKDSREKPLEDLEDLVIEENDQSILLSIMEDVIFEKLDDYFKDNSIVYESIDYNDVVNYAKEHNFPIEKVKHIETNYDYSKIISNYSDIERYVKNAELKIREELGLS